MLGTTRAFIVVLLALLTEVGTPAHSDEKVHFEKLFLAGDEYGIHTGEAEGLALRVIDRATGRPIGGARVVLYRGEAHPVLGSALPIGFTVSDGGGWARYIYAGGTGAAWAYVEATGYAPQAVWYERFGGIVELEHGVDLPLRFLDHLGSPIENLRVEWIPGSGDSPAARVSHTDSRGNCTIRGYSPRQPGFIWISGETVRSEYVSIGTSWRSRRPVVHYCHPGRVVEGYVVGSRDQPLRGIAVGVNDGLRGPWALTDSRGFFRLRGVERQAGEFASIDLFGGAAGVVGRTVVFRVPPRGVARTVRVPELGGQEVAESEPRIDVRVRSPRSPVEGMTLWACRQSDGWTSDLPFASEEGAYLQASLPEGVYEFSAEWLGEQVTSETIIVEQGAQARFQPDMELQEHRVDMSCVPDGASLDLATARGLTAIYSEGSVARLLVPSAIRDAYVRTRQHGIVQVAMLKNGGTAVDASSADCIEPLTVIMRPVDEQGSPVAVRVREAGRDEALSLEDDGSGVVTFHVFPRAQQELMVSIEPLARSLDSIEWPVSYARARGGTVDLGQVVLPQLTQGILILEEVDEAAASAMHMRISWDRWQQFEASANSDGVVHIERIPPDWVTTEGTARIHVEKSSSEPDLVYLPWTSTIDGLPPWRIQVPQGELELTVVDQDGLLIPEARVLVNGNPCLAPEGRLRIFRLRPGAASLVVLARGYAPAAWRFDHSAESTVHFKAQLAR